MTQDNLIKLSQSGTFSDPLTEVLRNGARALLACIINGSRTRFSPSRGSRPTCSMRSKRAATPSWRRGRSLRRIRSQSRPTAMSAPPTPALAAPWRRGIDRLPVILGRAKGANPESRRAA